MLRSWVRRAERDRIKVLERENRELRQINETLRKASASFAQAELDRRLRRRIAVIDDHRRAYGVEPICKVLPIAHRLTTPAPPTSTGFGALGQTG